MTDKKEEAVEARVPMDVVIPLSNESKHDNLELKLALRSIEKNLKDVGTIWIVTLHKPGWLTNANHIRYRDIFKENKDANIIGKVIQACKKEPVSENFVFLSDDQLFLQEMSVYDIKVYHNGDLKDRNRYDAECNWSQRLKHSRNTLLSEEKPTMNYESHCPVVYNKEMFLKIYSQYEWWIDGRGNGFTINTIYFNNIFSRKKHGHGKPIPASKVKATFEKDFNKKLTPEERIALIQDKIKNKLFIGYNDKGFTTEIRGMLKAMFPDECKFEREPVVPKLKDGVLEQTVNQVCDDLAMLSLDIRHQVIRQVAQMNVTAKRLNKSANQLFGKQITVLEDIKVKVEEFVTLKQAEDYYKSHKIE